MSEGGAARIGRARCGGRLLQRFFERRHRNVGQRPCQRLGLGSRDGRDRERFDAAGERALARSLAGAAAVAQPPDSSRHDGAVQADVNWR